VSTVASASNTPASTIPGTAPNELGALLRHWRDLRGKSQLGLALDSGVSQRHISFIESGRSAPGRETLMTLARALDIPLRERNALLLAAGYAPLYAEGAWDAHDMQGVSKALARMLRQHEPFPAVVMDRYWNVLMANEAAPHFFTRFVDLAARPAPRNLLHLLFDPQGMRPFIANWEALAASLIQRVRREAVGRVVDARTDALLKELLAYPGVDSRWAAPQAAGVPAALLPVVPLSVIHGGQVFSYFSMVSTVGTPQTIAAQELRVECLFPADAITEDRHAALMAAAQSVNAPSCTSV
jgi:transcriptional regulator with XRE-family HTH domain